MQRVKMLLQMFLEKDVGQNASFKKKVVHQPRLIRLTFSIYLENQTCSNAPYKGVKILIQN